VLGFSDHKLALVVHRDMTMLSALQSAYARRGFTVVVARDLPTALLAITQHHLDAAMISANLAEHGDGFPLAGIIQRIFPEAQVCVGTISVEVPELLSAINNGVQKVVDLYSADADSVVASALASRSATKAQA
jgi:ActR/RegA family two-component response regulator